MKRILVIGGGVIGLFVAYFLRKSGHQVTIVDKSDCSNSCSFGNAGLIVPSHVVPLASPGMVSAAFKYLFDPKAPVAVKLPPSLDFVRWSLGFLRSANSHHVQASASVLKELSLFSKELYGNLIAGSEFPLAMNEKGLLIVCRSRKVFKEEIEAAELTKSVGLAAEVLSREELLAKEPGISGDIVGGIYYPGDCHLNPMLLMTTLLKKLREDEVAIQTNTTVSGFEKTGASVKAAIVNGQKHHFDEIVISAGAWSNTLLKLVGTRVRLQPGRGYSFDVPNSGEIQFPTLLIDSRVSVTPFDNGTVRFGGGMELGYFGRNIFQKRVDEIRRAIRQYYPGMVNRMNGNVSVWQGHRPCSFDGLPYIGKIPGLDNMYLATGHSMMGVTLAPATGKLIAEMIDHNNTSLDVNPFRIDRR